MRQGITFTECVLFLSIVLSNSQIHSLHHLNFFKLQIIVEIIMYNIRQWLAHSTLNKCQIPSFSNL